MQKKLVAAVLVALIGGLTSTFDIKAANASGTIYIKAYGGVIPSQAPIQIDGKVYTFVDDIFDPIVVERSNIVINGAGYALRGDMHASKNGITLSNRKNVTIKHVEIKNFFKGIYLEYSSNNSIYGNNIANNDNGIWLSESSNNNISGNIVKRNGFSGIYLTHFSDYNIIHENNMTDNVASIHLSYSSNNTITWNNIPYGGTHALGLWYSNSNRIYSNYITANREGIILFKCSYNILKGNSLTARTRAHFRIVGSKLRHFVNDVDSSNMVDGKPIHYWIGKLDMSVPLDAGMVILVNCTRITVKDLNINGNEQGILLAYTINSTITRNYIANNDNGITLYRSSNNRIYHNEFLDNNKQVFSEKSTNVWDDGYPSGGNYWSDYKGVDANGDGMGDTPYVIDASNQDNYPLCTRPPFWMQWWFWIIVAAGIGVVIGAVYLKKRKLSTARRRLGKRRLIRWKDFELGFSNAYAARARILALFIYSTSRPNARYLLTKKSFTSCPVR